MKRDIATFTGKTGQYVFVSSASVYEKPVRRYIMTERTSSRTSTGSTVATRSPARDCCATRRSSPTPSCVRAHTVRTDMPIQVGDPVAPSGGCLPESR